MSLRQRELITSVQKITSLLANENIGVKFSDTIKTASANITNRTITLPTIPKDVPEDLERTIQGLVDHETAHILYTKNLDGSIPKWPQDHTAHVVNIVEDARINRLMGNRYLGCKENIFKTCVEIFSKSYNKKDELPKELKELLEEISEDSDIEKVLEARAVYMDKMKSLQVATWQYVWGNNSLLGYVTEDVPEYLETLPDSLRELLESVESYEDVLETVEPIFEWLNLSEEEKEGLSEQAKESNHGEGGEDGSEEGETEEGEGDNDEGGTPSAGVGVGSSHTRGAEGSADYSSGAAEIFRAARLEGDLSKPYISDTSKDITMHIRDYGLTPKEGGSLFDEIAPHVSAVRGRLIRDLSADGKIFQGRQNKGSLDMASGHRILLAKQDLFRRRVPREEVNTAVSLVIDQSGSMKYYGRVKPALQLAAVFCEALSRADIPCEVTSFTTDSPNGKRVDTKYGTRREPLLLTVLKDFNESFRNTQAYWGGISSHCMDNIDGESIMMAAQRLHKRQESRKVMIVLSDGMPAGVLRRGYGDDHIENDLKDTIKRCERAGIETLGIGIQTDAVKEFYPKYAVYQNLNTMISDVYQKISVLLRHGTLS